jgi:hypothetical protein
MPGKRTHYMLKSHNKSILEALGRNPIHPFPARMAPGIALEALGESKAPLRVLDPMVGSGTVLAVARARGHHAFGVDLDPLDYPPAKRIRRKAMRRPENSFGIGSMTTRVVS